MMNFSPSIVNIIVCDEVTKLRGRDLLFNPFFKAPPAPLTFVTYTTVANVPNGIINFKFRLTNPMNEVMHETNIMAAEVKENVFCNVTFWNNMPFSINGDHTITLYLGGNDGSFEPLGGNVILVSDQV